MEAFIVRPFNVKQEVDFERVHNELIKPALEELKISGDTTAAIIEQGNIREDMFSKLLTADLVIADISIHNANVFYELGIRHALQDKRTFLIRCQKDEVPFDLKTDRYLSYDAENPAKCLPQLIAGLKATISSDKADSPVFYMLPKLEAQDRERFLAVPQEFGEEVERAKESRQKGMLALLASEALGFPWEIPALRVVGNAQFALKDFEAAKITWEKIRDRYGADVEANDRLATIYQRLADAEMVQNPVIAKDYVTRSDQAINRLLENYNKLSKNKRAEVYSLKARNTKFRWIDCFRSAPQGQARKVALQSMYLLDSYKDYDLAYSEDLNHFYSGVNALGLLTALIELAETLPEEWLEEFDTDDEAALQLKKFKERQQNLAIAVQISLEAEKRRLEKENKKDPWVAITEADLYCLISTKPKRVANLYRDAILAASEQNFEAARRQLLLYKEVGVLVNNVEAALAEFAIPAQEESSQHFVLFTGHMIDKADRSEPRFPQSKESAVANAIRIELEKIAAKHKKIIGIAGGACGGDIIFHEECAKLDIKTELYLALPRETFITKSVQFAGTDWIDRFNELYNKLPRRVLSEVERLPAWLQKKPNYSIWQRNNLWMLNSAMACGGINMTLLALWNGKGGDDVGGTEDMVKESRKRGSKVNVIPINEL